MSASWDGTYVAWASNFGLNASGYADIYTIRVDTSGAGGGGGGGPLAVAFTNPGNAPQVCGPVTVSVHAEATHALSHLAIKISAHRPGSVSRLLEEELARPGG